MGFKPRATIRPNGLLHVVFSPAKGNFPVLPYRVSRARIAILRLADAARIHDERPAKLCFRRQMYVAHEQKIGIIDGVQFGFPERHRTVLRKVFVKRFRGHRVTRDADVR